MALITLSGLTSLPADWLKSIRFLPRFRPSRAKGGPKSLVGLATTGSRAEGCGHAETVRPGVGNGSQRASGDLDVQDELPQLQEAVLLLLDSPKPEDEHRACALRRVLVQHLNRHHETLKHNPKNSCRDQPA